MKALTSHKPGAVSSFVDAMAGGVAVVAYLDESGRPLATAVSGIASYSIDPPSIFASLPREVTGRLPDVFGVSLLGREQDSLASELADGIHELGKESLAVIDGAPLVRDALAQLVCSLAFQAKSSGGAIVVAEVKRASVDSRDPLVWGLGETREERP